jgi:hypothetical protein
MSIVRPTRMEKVERGCGVASRRIESLRARKDERRSRAEGAPIRAIIRPPRGSQAQNARLARELELGACRRVVGRRANGIHRAPMRARSRGRLRRGRSSREPLPLPAPRALVSPCRGSRLEPAVAAPPPARFEEPAPHCRPLDRPELAVALRAIAHRAAWRRAILNHGGARARRRTTCRRCSARAGRSAGGGDRPRRSSRCGPGRDQTPAAILRPTAASSATASSPSSSASSRTSTTTPSAVE